MCKHKSYLLLVVIIMILGSLHLSAQSTCSASNSIASCTATCSAGTAVCTAPAGQTPECKCQGGTFIESMRRLSGQQQSISQENFAVLYQKVVTSKKPVLALEEEIETYWKPLFKSNKPALQAVSKLLRESLGGVLNNDRDYYNDKMNLLAKHLDKISDLDEKDRITKKIALDLKQVERSEALSKTMHESVQANNNAQQDIPTHLNVSGHPNPFSDKITIRYSLPSKSFAKLAVYDVMGNSVKLLYQGNANPGQYTVEWDGSGNTQPMSNGLYFVRLEANNTVFTQRIIVNR